MSPFAPMLFITDLASSAVSGAFKRAPELNGITAKVLLSATPDSIRESISLI